MHIALWVRGQDGRRLHHRHKLPAGLLDSVIHQTQQDLLPQHLHLLEFLFLVLVGAISLVSVNIIYHNLIYKIMLKLMAMKICTTLIYNMSPIPVGLQEGQSSVVEM